MCTTPLGNTRLHFQLAHMIFFCEFAFTLNAMKMEEVLSESRSV